MAIDPYFEREYNVRALRDDFQEVIADWGARSADLRYRVDCDLGLEYGADEVRNADFESDDDETLILGLVLKPVRWIRMNADYEEGDITQAFTAAAPRETDRLRLRATFQPQPEMRLDLSYLDYENTNNGTDFRKELHKLQHIDCQRLTARNVKRMRGKLSRTATNQVFVTENKQIVALDDLF